MESKSVKIVIIIAVIIGIIAIVGITALAVMTTKSSGPRVIDLNNEEQMAEVDDTELETEDAEINENEEETTENNTEENAEENNEENVSMTEESTNSEQSALKSFNAKLKEYAGDRVSGKKLNELLDIIRRNNEQNKDYQIKALADVQNWDSENSKAKEDCMYDVDIEEDEQTGKITRIEIKDAD